MSIIRVRKDDRYFVAPNEPFNNESLSWEARGIIAYLLSKPDGWEVRTKDLVRRGPAGRDKVRRVLAELEEHGYLHRYQGRQVSGSFDGWITEVYESPTLNPHFSPVTGLAAPVNPSPPNQTLSNTNEVNTHHHDDDADQPVDNLVSIGFTTRDAKRLMAKIRPFYPTDLENIIDNWLAYIAGNRRIRNPAGFLRVKLEGGEYPPAPQEDDPIPSQYRDIIKR